MRLTTLSVLTLLCMLWSSSAQAQSGMTYWRDGVPTVVFTPDSVFFWDAAAIGVSEGGDEMNTEPTETESLLMSMTNDEESAQPVVYSEADSLAHDALAQEVLRLFATGGASKVRRITREEEDSLAQEAIRNNGVNIFSEENLIIEQQDWNSGLWGKNRYGGFETYYNTYRENGKRYLLVVFYHQGGFPSDVTAFLKLGQLNSGKVLDKQYIDHGTEYKVLTACIDDFIKDYGCVNFFPLLITNSTQAREYLNPLMVKTNPIVPDGWRDFGYGEEFGTINGVSVYSNTGRDRNIGGDEFQCVNLCKRYIISLNSNITRRSTWSHAIQWPHERANDDTDPGKYIVYANNGSTQVREGDILVWNYSQYGHIGVVIKTTPTYISVAHQNGGAGTNALPIGSTLVLEDGIVIDRKPGSNQSPIFKESQAIPYLIRINHDGEHGSAYAAAMSVSTTNLAFNNTTIGTTAYKTFSIKNSGYATLTVKSINVLEGKNFKVDVTECTIEHGETRDITVAFTPTAVGTYEGKICITSDADDHPTWYITLTGTGISGNLGEMPTQGMVAYYPFNGNANDESGNGNHGTPTGQAELATGVSGDANGAYQFGGYDHPGSIAVKNSESLQFTDEASFSFYIKPTGWVSMDGWGSRINSNGVQCVIAKEHDRRGITFEVKGNNDSFRVWMGSMDNQAWANLSSGEQLTGNYLNKWTHVAFVYGKTYARLYVDGQLMDERETTPNFTRMNAQNLYIGKFSDYWYPFNGLVDEVRIYNRALTAAEVISLARYSMPLATGDTTK